MTRQISPTLPELRTDRLILRPPIQEDFDAWAEFSADEQVTRHIGGPQSRAAAWRTMAMHSGSWLLKGFGLFSVIERKSGDWIGRAGPWYPEAWPDPEIGWSLARSAWGQGYATEAASAALAWAFDALGWERVVHYITPENLASIAVAERIGSSRQGETLLPPPIPASQTFIVYGQQRP